MKRPRERRRDCGRRPRRDQSRCISPPADGLVPRQRARAALARDERPVPHLGRGDHAAADAGGCGGRTLQRVPAALSHAGLAGVGQRGWRCWWRGRGWATTAARGCCTRRRSSSWASARDGCRRRAAELRTLPGIGEYTAAAIASIAFGEGVAVVDGNVERVVLRLTGRASENTAAARGFVRAQAQALLPQRARDGLAAGGAIRRRRGLAAVTDNPAGDHNQAMMELGATVCLPRAPRCSECPVCELCRTRGEHRRPRARRSAASPSPACWTCASAARPPRSCCNAGPRTPA